MAAKHLKSSCWSLLVGWCFAVVTHSFKVQPKINFTVTTNTYWPESFSGFIQRLFFNLYYLWPFPYGSANGFSSFAWVVSPAALRLFIIEEGGLKTDLLKIIFNSFASIFLPISTLFSLYCVQDWIKENHTCSVFLNLHIIMWWWLEEQMGEQIGKKTIQQIQGLTQFYEFQWQAIGFYILRMRIIPAWYP